MNKPASYNLLDPGPDLGWIPVKWRPDVEPGAPEIGIREALQRAGEIKCISHTAPFIEFGLYRLLITIVLDAYILDRQRPTIGRMKAMLEAGKFDPCVVGKYLDTYGDRFDIWHDQTPFLQRPGLSGAAGDISKMIAPVPSGTKITWWHHHLETDTRLTVVEAARELCSVAPFCFDYAPKDICTIGGDPPLYIVVQGENLFETIVYNLPRPSGRLNARQEMDDGPAWRSIVQDTAALPRSPTHAQAWTWPVRQLLLIRTDDAEVIGKAVNIAGAEKTAARRRVRGWRDPNAGTITSAKGVRQLRAGDLVPGFARTAGQGDQNPMVFWRDIVPMCLVASEGEALRGERLRSRPEAVTNALRITQGQLLRLAVYGFVDKGGKNNKVFRMWFRSVLTLPAEVAHDSRLSARAIIAFNTAQSVASALQKALQLLRPPLKANRGRRPPPGRGDSDVLADFWQSLELILSRDYLNELGSGNSQAEATLWERIRQEARRSFFRATGPQRRTADGLFRIANASNWLERRLGSILPKPRQEKHS